MRNRRTSKRLVLTIGVLGALLSLGAAAQKTTTTADTTTWIRSEAVGCYPNTGQFITLLTVPTTATRPYFLRQSFSTWGSLVGAATGAWVYANDKAVMPVVTGAQTALNVPFSAGEVIAVRCSGNSLETPGMSFVFSY